MFVALDKQGNRVHADDAIKSKSYICQKCGKEVKPKQGNINKWHFAHAIDEGCDYGKDSDHKGEWHMRMQEYFPKDSREYRFIDYETNEVHIADVFIEECNTVLEFQHSRIEENEFSKRTSFHLNNNRRIVWLFNENIITKDGNSSCRIKYIEKFQKEWYKWLRNPRKCLQNGPDIKENIDKYSICIYTGLEGDVFRRILDEKQNFGEIALSDKKICININNVDLIEEIFDTENYIYTTNIKKHNRERVFAKNYYEQYLEEIEEIKFKYPIGKKLYYVHKDTNNIEVAKIVDYDIGHYQVKVTNDNYPNQIGKVRIDDIGSIIFETIYDLKKVNYK